VSPENQAENVVVQRTEASVRYLGWRVALVCHLGVLTGFATVFIYSFSFMVKPLQAEFGWNREEVSRAFSLAAISVAICSPLMGKLFDSFSPRKLIAAMMAAFGLGMCSLAFLTPRLSQFYVSAVLIGIAGCGTYQLGYARIVTAWFERRLGAALSIVVAGSGVGSLLIPSLTQFLIRTYGWRDTYFVLGSLPILIGAPLTLIFARAPHAPSNVSKDALEARSSIGLPLMESVASLSFWLLALGVCALSLSENGALAHLAPMMSDAGLSSRAVAYTASILGISSVIGRLALGTMLDYLKGSYIATGSLLAAGAGIFLLTHAHTFAAAAPAAFLAGLGAGCELDLVPYMLRRYFGLRSFSTLYGLVYTFFALAGAIAPVVVGHVYDSVGSYSKTLSIFSSITIAAALAMFALPKYRYASSSDEQTHAQAVDKDGWGITADEAVFKHTEPPATQ
jgi:MFS family permease